MRDRAARYNDSINKYKVTMYAPWCAVPCQRLKYQILFLFNGIYILFIGIWFRWIHNFLLNERTSTGASIQLKFNWIWCQFNFVFFHFDACFWFNKNLIDSEEASNMKKTKKNNWIDININNHGMGNGMTFVLSFLYFMLDYNWISLRCRRRLMTAFFVCSFRLRHK